MQLFLSIPPFSSFAMKNYSDDLPSCYLLPLFSLLSFVYALITGIINSDTLHYPTYG